MKRKGFTLIEVLGVIALVALLSIVAIPLVINQVNQSRGKLDAAAIKLIEEAAFQYIDTNQGKTPKKAGNSYCIKLKTLADFGYIKEPFINPSTGDEIDLEKIVKVSFVSDLEAEYEILEAGSSCVEIRY